ncbi:hypothetical protein J2Z65_005632 [Paenibacillus aceris]|uniref:Uncharacterized protein n=1 Tax=Paenibacillus aceris TaxID=869555 RepID=A0ABS4I631_9BACL|nr:hypothetical protein [Paenibacillus aceris]
MCEHENRLPYLRRCIAMMGDGGTFLVRERGNYRALFH